jgi:LacI family transcriptional regulator
MRVTIRDVANRAGVSPMTVSRVINDRPRVSDDTRRRVQGAIVELGYVPNRLARGLIRRTTHAFGVIVPDVGNPFFTLVVRGAEEAAWRAGYHVILCNTQADLERERGYVEDMLAFQVDGVLIAAVSDRSHAHLKLLTRNGVPFVLVDRSVAGFDTDLVQGDSVGGARQLVEHLIGLGHRRIAMITDERGDVSTARDRVHGYRAALEAAGIEFLPELVVETSTVDPQLAYQATLDMLDHVEPPTALFAVNNIVVIGVAEAVRARSLEIPRDIAVVCFDDIEYASRFHPFLTAMIQPAETFGTVATQLLLDRLAGRVHERRRLVVLPSDLIVRESCGARLPVS